MADFLPLVHLQVQFDVQEADQSSAKVGWRNINKTEKERRKYFNVFFVLILELFERLKKYFNILLDQNILSELLRHALIFVKSWTVGNGPGVSVKKAKMVAQHRMELC